MIRPKFRSLRSSIVCGEGISPRPFSIDLIEQRRWALLQVPQILATSWGTARIGFPEMAVVKKRFISVMPNLHSVTVPSRIFKSRVAVPSILVISVKDKSRLVVCMLFSMTQAGKNFLIRNSIGMRRYFSIKASSLLE